MSALSASGFIDFAGRQPLWQAGAIVLGTFILEDAATVLAAIQAAAGGIPVSVALGALYVGIVLGDMGLYGLGRLAALFPRLRRLLPARRVEKGRAWVDTHIVRVVFISRFLPGARLPTYTACGFIRASFLRFALAATAATLVWTSLLFTVSMKIGALLLTYLGAWRWAGIAGFVLVVVLAGRLLARFRIDDA